MNCPGCKSEDLQPINKEETHFYCTNCNNGFQKGAKEIADGSLNFEGVVTAQKIFDVLTGERDDMSPELKSALETQMTGLIFEQWFEGFKAGQLANIAYTRNYYDNGKTRSKSDSTTDKHGNGAEHTTSKASHREDSSSRDSDPKSNSSDSRVKELVAGVKFTYPKHIKVPENIYTQLALLVDDLLHHTEHKEIKQVDYDGRYLSVIFKT